MVGRTTAGYFCHIPVAVEGTPCTALVDTGSTVTIVWPDVVPVGFVRQRYNLELSQVGRPLLGKKIMSLTVGEQTVQHLVWVAGVQDPCILGLDFLIFRLPFGLKRGHLSFWGRA